MLQCFCSWHAQEARTPPRPPIHNYRQCNDCGMGVHPVGDSNVQEAPRRWSAWVGIGSTSRPPRDRRRFVELGWMAGRSLEGVGRWTASTAYRSLSLEALSFPHEDKRRGWDGAVGGSVFADGEEEDVSL